jgi:hypothetical protein
LLQRKSFPLSSSRPERDSGGVGVADPLIDNHVAIAQAVHHKASQNAAPIKNLQLARSTVDPAGIGSRSTLETTSIREVQNAKDSIFA